MVRIAYAHDGTSLYDLFFLDYLSSVNTVYFLTFNRDPEGIPKKAIIVKMPNNVSVNSKMEMLYISALSSLRALILRFFLNCTNSDVLLGCTATKYGFYSALSGFKPFVLIVWGSDVLVDPQRFFVFRLWAQFTLKRADAVIVDSKVQEDAAIRLGCDPKKILKFPWFDSEGVRVKHSRAEVRKKLDWSDNPIVICTRRHEPICGVQYVIEAVPSIVRALPETRFLIVGDGQLTVKLKHMVNELGTQEYVKFLGRVSHEEATTYLNAADVNVSMSLSDGTSASLLEAMSLGVPSIVTSIPGNMEWIKDGWNGYLVPVGDSRQLADKVVLLLKDEKLRKQVVEKACETISEQVNWSANSKALHNLISKLAKEKHARDR